MKNPIRNRILAGILSFQLCFGLLPISVLNSYSSNTPVAVQTAASQIIYVPSQGDLQSAINSISNGGVIEIAPGTYPVPTNGYILNELHKGFKIRAQNGSQVILDGGGVHSILRFQNTFVVNGGWITFEGITFANGRSDTPGLAAGVTMMNAQGTFLNCIFNNNFAASNGTGGGIFIALNSTALFVNDSWQNNSAVTHGAGMVVADHSKVYIHNSQFTNNRVNLPGHTEYSSGGGIHIGNSSVRISNTRFEGNQAGYVGGGLFAIGTWGDSWTTDVIIANSTFINNKAISDPSVNLSFPTEGGAVHIESHAVAQIYNSRFITNSAEAGGAISLYLSTLIVEGGIFLGNQAVGTTYGGYGGAITGNSNDTQLDGNINRLPVKITVNNSYFQGRYGSVTTVGLGGGGIFLGGDYNRQYGQGGVTQMGGFTENRAQLTINNSAFSDLDVTKSDGGIGGAIYGCLVALNLQNSIVIKSDTSGTYGSGGGIALIDQSKGVINNSTFAKNTSSFFGGALNSDGAELYISNSNLIENSVSSKYGGAIFASSNSNTQLGMVSANTISNNTSNGSDINVYDDDRKESGANMNIFYNQMVYNSNTFYASGGTSAQVYSDSLVAGSQTVAQLNRLVIPRAVGEPTYKSTIENTALQTAPVVGNLMAVPAIILSSGAPGDAIQPTGSYLTYAWSGATAKLDNTDLTGNAGSNSVQAAGPHTLSVGNNNYSASVSQAPLPSGNVSISGSSPFYAINWSMTSGSFIEDMIDQGVNIASASSGSALINPVVDNLTYSFYAITKEGGFFTSKLLNPPILAVSSPFTIYDGLNLSSHIYGIPINNSGNGTLDWTASASPSGTAFSVLTPCGQTTGADSIKIQITKNTTGIYQGIIFVDSGIGGIKSINLEIHIVDVINNIFIPKVYR